MSQEQSLLIEENDIPFEERLPLMKVVGYGCAFLSAIAFGASGACSQPLGGYVPPFELNLWRFTTQVVLALMVIIPFRLDIRVPREKIPWLLLLCLAYNGHNTTFYESSIYLPVAEMICINNFLAVTLSFFLALALHRKFSCNEVIAICLCVAGILLVTQPHVLFPKAARGIVSHPVCQTSSDAVQFLPDAGPTAAAAAGDDGAQNFWNSSKQWMYTMNVSGNVTGTAGKAVSRRWLGDSLAAASAVFFVLRTYVTNQKLQGIGPAVVAFWVAVSGVLLSAAALLGLERAVFPPDSTCQLLLFGHALSASFAALAATVGEMNVHPTIFAMILSLETVVLLCAQYTVLKNINPGHRNIIEIMGAVLVFLGSTGGPLCSLLKDAQKP